MPVRRGVGRCGLGAALLLVFAIRANAAGDALFRGEVRDSTGAGVAGATVKPRRPAGPLPAVTTGSDGSFAFDPEGASEGRLVVSAPGFADVECAWSIGTDGPLVIVVGEERRTEEVTVTASRTEERLADTASRVVVIGGRDLQSVAAPTLDDALRLAPGFSLFRRSDSRVANPTAQGASLRGVGASGASRSVVVLDGVPLNDPFGGWVDWSREPRIAVERVEVMEGGASDLYGSAALGGVIQAIERRDAPAAALELSGGTLATGDVSAYGAVGRDVWRLRAAAQAFTTDGYVLVPADARGPVDTAAGGSHLNAALTLERRLSPNATVFVRGAALGESRTNGTPQQVNDTDWRQVSVGADTTSNGAGSFAARAWWGDQVYHQTFSAVSADRTTELLTRRQRVPSEAVGASLQWSGTVGSRHALLAGAEGRWVDGRSDETPFVRGVPASLVSAGGHDRTLALFAADRVALGSRAVLTLGGRLDRWSGGERGATAVSPRASLLLRASSRVSLTAAGYGAFRAPTLNELYRSFRVGNTITRANAALTVERLGGGEAGIVWSPRGRFRIRGVAFASWIDDPIANATLTTTPDLITRERQNLGRTRSRGLEVDAETPVGPWFRVTAGYAWIDATVRSFPANPAIEGNLLPQVPRHQATLALRFGRPRLFDLRVEARATSEQFEDDRNQLPLAGYVTLDGRIARRMGRVSLFAVVENMTGKRHTVGLTAVPTVGPPRSWRVGVRFE
jgi:outer membrane receptor protein involved in Fe transport